MATNGAVLHRHELGTGAPLLALHGAFGTGRAFADLAGQLVEVRVIAPDLRGHGRSLPDPPWHIEQHVADVLATVDDLSEFDLLGSSFGGAVAAYLAVTVPRRVRRLLLLDPALGLDADFVLPKVRSVLQRDRADAWTDDGRRLSSEGAEKGAVITAFSEACREIPPPPDSVPVLLVRAARNPRGSARLAAAWSDLPLVRVTTVDCGHHLLRDCAAQTAALIADFLTTPRDDLVAERV